MNISISVIIPTYNRAHTVGRAIESILSQTIPVNEIIIVDDGSKDNIVEVMQKYTSHVNPSIQFVKLEHAGAMHARNHGIKVATSDYICFLDSDDYWLENRIEAVYKSITEYPDCIITNTCILADGINDSKWDLKGKSGDVYRDLLSRPWPMFQGMVAKKECFDSIGYLDENILSYQEWETSIRLAKKYKFIYIDIPLFIYTVNKEKNTISKSKNADKGYWQVITKHRKEIVRYCGIRGLIRHLIVYCRFRIIRIFAK